MLAAVVEGPYFVKSVQNMKAVIEMTYQTVENVSNSHVALTSRPITEKGLQEFKIPMTNEDLGTEYPTKTSINMNNLPSSNNNDKEDPKLRRSARLRQRD